MKRFSNVKQLQEYRVQLRKNQTLHEGLLWQHLKNKKLGVKFRRQHSVGPYILDFYCTEKKLGIEIDGSQHLKNKEYDTERTNYLKHKEGINILRFWNNDFHNIDSIIMKIQQTLLET